MQGVLRDPEPWPDPVDGAELAEELAELFLRFVVLPAGAADALALWVLHSHAHQAAFISPILAITSPDKRCGKTTLLSILGAIVRRPLPTANASAATIFRAVEKWRPTLLIDEADTFLKDSEELRGALNSGHVRTGSFLRNIEVAGQYEPRSFSTWAPKAVALIGRMHPTLTDRSVAVPMRRKRPEEVVERLRLDKLDELADLPRRCARWADDHIGVLRLADPATPAGLNDRCADNWRTLLAIADTLGGPWPEKGRAALLRLVGEDDGDEATGVLLLGDMRGLFDELGLPIPSAKIAEALSKMEERPWPEWHHDKPITVRQIARLLKPFQIKPKNIRYDGQIPKGYDRTDFEDAFTRYLPAVSSATPLQPNDDGGKREFRSATQGDSVADDHDRKTASDRACSGVADQKPLPLEEEEVWT
jgi:putative DNA primase/helicase